MKKIYFIIILFIFPLLSEQTDWATTRFEKSWKKAFKQMTFRDPINFSPYSIKISYYNYGGKNFFVKVPKTTTANVYKNVIRAKLKNKHRTFIPVIINSIRVIDPNNSSNE